MLNSFFFKNIKQMTFENKIKTDILVSSIILFSFLLFYGSILVSAKGEGGFGDGIIVNFIADHLIHMFPLVLLWHYLKFEGPYTLLFFGLANIILYAFVLTLFSKKLSSITRYRPFNLIIGVAYIIPSIILIQVIYLIIAS